MKATRLLTTILTATAVGACGASAAAAPAAGPYDRPDRTGRSPDATLPSQCSDQQVAPVSVVVLCGDAGIVAQDLVWHDWGAPRTWASGTASVNTCEPSCAAGNREEHPIVLTAHRLVDCTYGRPQYTRITYSLPDSGPDRTVMLACPKRPHADPRIRTMRVSLTHHGIAGRLQLWLSVCAPRGRLDVVIKETRRLGGRTVAAHRRTRAFAQTERCESHRFTWKLRPELSGAGTFRVAATVRDADGQRSKTVSRTITTID